MKEESKEIESPKIENDNNIIALQIIEEYKQLIEELAKIKETGNSFFNEKNYDEAEKYYREGIDKIEKFVPSNVFLKLIHIKNLFMEIYLFHFQKKIILKKQFKFVYIF